MREESRNLERKRRRELIFCNIYYDICSAGDSNTGYAPFAQMKSQAHDPEWQLQHPRTRKWMVRCVACLQWGYRADAPETFFGRPHLVKYFEPMKLAERGVCERCSGK
jgi:hypothetical protein